MQGHPFKNPFSTTLAGTANSCKVRPSVVLWARLCAATSAELVRTVGSWLVFPAALAHWNFRDFCFLGWSCRGSCFVIVRPFLLSASPLTVWRATLPDRRRFALRLESCSGSFCLWCVFSFWLRDCRGRLLWRCRCLLFVIIAAIVFVRRLIRFSPGCLPAFSSASEVLRVADFQKVVPVSPCGCGCRLRQLQWPQPLGLVFSQSR